VESRAAKSDDPAVSVASILFPVGGGPRLSTILAISLFLTLAIAWGEKRPVLACLAWLFSFEVAFQVTSLAFGHHVEFLLLGLGLVLLPWLTQRGAKPSLSFLAVAFGLFAAWIAAGFHVNVNAHGMVGFDPAAEALNEATKTLWAVAYLVPLLRSAGWRGLSREPPPGVDAEGFALDTEAADLDAQGRDLGRGASADLACTHAASGEPVIGRIVGQE